MESVAGLEDNSEKQFQLEMEAQRGFERLSADVKAQGAAVEAKLDEWNAALQIQLDEASASTQKPAAAFILITLLAYRPLPPASTCTP